MILLSPHRPRPRMLSPLSCAILVYSSTRRTPHRYSMGMPGLIQVRELGGFSREVSTARKQRRAPHLPTPALPRRGSRRAVQWVVFLSVHTDHRKNDNSYGVRLLGARYRGGGRGLRYSRKCPYSGTKTPSYPCHVTIVSPDASRAGAPLQVLRTAPAKMASFRGDAEAIWPVGPSKARNDVYRYTTTVRTIFRACSSIAQQNAE
jgi:hypothetical protein